MMRNLVRIVVTDHVIGEDNETLPGQIDASPGNGSRGSVFEPAVLPVAMRRHNPWEWSLSTEWTVEVPAQIEAWNRFEKNFFYCVTLTFQFAENLSVQGPLFRHWQQSCAGQDLLSQ